MTMIIIMIMMTTKIMLIMKVWYPFRNSPIASNILKFLLVFPILFMKMSDYYLDFGHENLNPYLFYILLLMFC